MGSGKLSLEEISDGKYRLVISLDIELLSSLTRAQIATSPTCSVPQLNANPKPQKKAMKTLLSVTEIGEELDISRTKAYELARSGQLKSAKVGRLCHVPVACLHTYIDRLLSEDR
ncbi:helix-turn-helix domain-containing protein [Actinoallomurus iriomotensis]|uniref:Helix-turn-helix domain-containing protein n=1 Tax=Actinoallomurus iriomotensis TaxID=478107 RepID=A0A9W6S2J4_9ACTN|nr:helix-turn-helix domain-containing protein [Actinoallomurus iriomotensis]GLY85993.1 hypothetical protein Airi02_039220 [Actinoallomurus iriomotensis]